MPIQRFRETRFAPPDAFDDQANWFVHTRRLWMKFKNSRFFNYIKHSRLNPYHRGLEKVVADTPQQEQEIARAKGLSQYIDKNGVRCLVNFDGYPQEEYEKTGKVMRKNGDMSQRIPRDKDGKINLVAEEPILISIIPLEGVSLTGHVCMQYKDKVVNRVLHMDLNPIYPEYQDLAEYYFIYPSQLGINTKKLRCVMERHNILNIAKKYNIFNNNCVKNVATILKKVGVTDIDFLGPDKFGLTYPTPGNNPFGFGLKDWCMRHGVPVSQKEVALLYKYHEIPDLDKRAERYAAIRERHDRYKNYMINKQTASKLSKTRKKAARKVDSIFKTDLEHKRIPTWSKYAENKISNLVLGRDEK